MYVNWSDVHKDIPVISALDGVVSVKLAEEATLGTIEIYYRPLFHFYILREVVIVAKAKAEMR